MATRKVSGLRAIVLTGLAAGALGLAGVAAHAADYAEEYDDENAVSADYADEYQTGDYGRVRYADEGVLLSRSSTSDTGDLEELAGINAPVFPGDRLVTGSDERAEVQLASGVLVRVDRQSDLGFLALPQPYAEVADNTVLALDEGTLRLIVPRGADGVRVDTPACSVHLTGEADLRLEVDGDRTRVFSRRGVAEVVGDDGSTWVRAGTMTTVDAGYEPDALRVFNTAARDGFDRWVEEREASYRVSVEYDEDTYEELPDVVRPYYRELSYHGDWLQTPDYGWIWSPRGIGSGWRPYDDGYWNYGPHGYFWVAHEPWGWAPYHYGRWIWHGHRGWAWVPGRVFGGAWVSWSWGPTYVGWCPLDLWNRPALVVSLSHGYYDRHAWSFVSSIHIGHRDSFRYRVPYERVRPHFDRAVVVTRAPRVAPHRLAESSEWRERATREAATRRRLPLTEAKDVRAPRFDRQEARLLDRVRAGRPETGPARRATAPGRTRPPSAAPGSGGGLTGAPDRALPGTGNGRRAVTPGSSSNPAERRLDDARGRDRAPAAQPEGTRMREVYRRVTQAPAPQGAASQPRRPAEDSRARPPARPAAPPAARTPDKPRPVPRREPAAGRSGSETPRKDPDKDAADPKSPRAPVSRSVRAPGAVERSRSAPPSASRVDPPARRPSGAGPTLPRRVPAPAARTGEQRPAPTRAVPQAPRRPSAAGSTLPRRAPAPAARTGEQRPAPTRAMPQAPRRPSAAGPALPRRAPAPAAGTGEQRRPSPQARPSVQRAPRSSPPPAARPAPTRAPAPAARQGGAPPAPPRSAPAPQPQSRERGNGKKK